MPKQINETSELPEATPTTNEDGEIVGTGNDARLAMLARINDANDTADADQYADVKDDGTTEPFVVANANGEQEPLKDEAVVEPIVDHDADPAGTQDVAPAAEAAPTFKIKVNGKEIELTQEQLIIRAQKVEAADAYLAEAARIKKDAENTRAQPQLPDPDATARAEEEDRALVRAIQMGTEEEAMAAIRKLKTVPPSLTADEISRTVDERLTFKEAASKFQSEYQDLMGDDVLRKMVLQRDRELVAANDKRPYWDRYQEIGNELRSWRDALVKPAVTPEPKTVVSDKLNRKAAVANAPKAASVKAPAPANEDDKEESVSEIIAAIAKRRGGPQWANA